MDHQNRGSLSGRFQEISYDIGAVFQAVVVYANSSGQFWCQNTQFVSKILILSKKLSRLHMMQEMNPLTDVQRGTVCAAKFGEHGAWYRGIVNSVSGRKAKVYFVDYGNTEVVSLDDICNLKSEMRNLPALGIKCRLSNVESKGREWRREIIEAFEELVINKEFEVKLVGKEKNVYIVTLFDVVDNKDVGSHLQSVMHHVNLDATNQDSNWNKLIPFAAAASGIGLSLNVGSKVDVYVSYVDNPGDFWVQLLSSNMYLEELSQRLQMMCPQLQPIAQLYPGIYVAAKFSQDKRWYRGQVLEMFEDELVKVLFIDYGNSDIVSVADLRELTDEFCLLVPLAFRCYLENFHLRPRGDKAWVDAAKKLLKELTVNGCQCQVLKTTTSHKIVKLRVSGRDLAMQLLMMNVIRESNATQLLEAGFSGDSSPEQSLVDQTTSEMRLDGTETPKDIDKESLVLTRIDDDSREELDVGESVERVFKPNIKRLKQQWKYRGKIRAALKRLRKEIWRKKTPATHLEILRMCIEKFKK